MPISTRSPGPSRAGGPLSTASVIAPLITNTPSSERGVTSTVAGGQRHVPNVSGLPPTSSRLSEPNGSRSPFTANGV